MKNQRAKNKDKISKKEIKGFIITGIIQFIVSLIIALFQFYLTKTFGYSLTIN